MAQPMWFSGRGLCGIGIFPGRAFVCLSVGQVEARLMAEHRQGTAPGATGLAEDTQQIKLGPHAVAPSRAGLR